MAAGNVVSSSETIAIGGVGIDVDLAPGASAELPVVSGTASCDPALGYLLPPGDYQVVIEVPYRLDSVASAPLPIVISG